MELLRSTGHTVNGMVLANSNQMLEDAPSPTGQPKLLDRVRAAIRARHYSHRTEVAYVTWIRRYIVFHKKVHPTTLGAPEIGVFLSWLATERHVSFTTQNQALAALLFLTIAIQRRC